MCVAHANVWYMRVSGTCVCSHVCVRQDPHTGKNGTFHVCYPPAIVCCSYVFVCSLYVTVYIGMYLYITGMSLIYLYSYSYTCNCISLIYLYVTHMYLYVTRMYPCGVLITIIVTGRIKNSMNICLPQSVNHMVRSKIKERS